ncbi:MAG: class I SAM-dependent methyltransferase [Neomegalonema sp.]|nr:class I SAM-dependent methyltransferase [Neomegalonema sp.]
MHLDATLLRDFYYGTPLGKLAQQRLQIALGEIWPSVAGLSVCGFGFAAPLLRPLRRQAARTLALMPAGQGVIQWPREGPNVAALCEEYLWPLRTGFLDRLVLAHGLEAAERPARLLDECWRVLAPEGRLIVIVPNRSGLWARRDATPFGFGRPYSVDQLHNQLEAGGFGVERSEGALFFPPSSRRYWHQAANLAERIGKRLDLRRLAGVLLVEAIKRVPAPPSGRPAVAAQPVGAGVWPVPATA